MESGELWGRPPQASPFPKVKAFIGPLPDGEAGIEFITEVAPDPGNAPRRVDWSGPRDGVRADSDFARITIVVTKFVAREELP